MRRLAAFVPERSMETIAGHSAARRRAIATVRPLRSVVRNGAEVGDVERGARLRRR